MAGASNTRVRNLLGRAGSYLAEKAWGSGMWNVFGSSVPKSHPGNFWQMDMPVPDMDYANFGPIQTCINILSQDMSRIPMRHWRIEKNQQRTLITERAPHRVFRKPNPYQTRSDFILYLMRSLLNDGNAYGVARRNDRNEIAAIYPMNPRLCMPYIAENGEVFYSVMTGKQLDLMLGDEDVPIEDYYWVPARDMLHIRLHTPVHPLLGESPVVSALYSAITGTEINRHTAAFFRNMGRPSGVLRHPGKLTEEAMQRIKASFMALTQGNSTGEPVVLREGMEWQQLTMTAVDAALVDIYKLSNQQVLQIFRIPEFLAGDLSKATLNNVDSLSQWYITASLGFYIDHLEENFEAFFGIKDGEQLRFDIEDVLLRADLESRMSAYGKAVQNGIMAPNEARRKENLPPVEHGDAPRVQQQLVPLSFGVNLQPPDPEPAPDPAPEPDDDVIDVEEAASNILNIVRAA